MKIRTYSDLIRLSTFEERFDYLSLLGTVGSTTFGFDRYLNQIFYNSRQWRNVCREIHIRDNACDLAIPGRDILSGIRVHHMNPATVEDFENNLDLLLDPEFLICTSLNTHNALHFGNKKTPTSLPLERRKGDTTPWKKY